MTIYEAKVTNAILELTHRVRDVKGEEKVQVCFEANSNKYSVVYYEDDHYGLVVGDRPKPLVTVYDHTQCVMAIATFAEAIRLLEENN